MSRFFSQLYVSVASGEGTIKKCKNLDFVLEHAYQKNLPSYPATVQTMNSLTALAYVPALSAGLIEIKQYKMNISSVVCDGCKAQKKAFSPRWENSLPRTSKHPWVKQIIFIPCLAHRIQNAFEYAMEHDDANASFSKRLHLISEVLISQEGSIGAICPRHVSTRWVYDFDIAQFIKDHPCSLEVCTLPENLKTALRFFQYSKLSL
jgi:hypothetical protein